MDEVPCRPARGSRIDQIEQAWESFIRDADPATTMRGALPELKRAFFAGAAASAQLYLEIGEPHISEEEGVARLEGLVAELQSFNVAGRTGEP